MSNKERILEKLQRLISYYQHDPTKKFQKKAIQVAIPIIQNYEKEIDQIEVFEEDIHKRGIKGIGKGILDRMRSILQTDTLEEFQQYESQDEKNQIMELFQSITGVGDKRAEEWYLLGYRSIDDIRNAIQRNDIQGTHHILLGLKYYEDLKNRIPRSEIDKMKKKIEKILKEVDPHLIFEICGSYRRGNADSGDMDLIVSHPSYIQNIQEQNYLKRIVEEGIRQGFLVDHLTEKGDKKYMGFCKNTKKGLGRRIDIRVFSYENYWAGILYFTGNREFNIRVRNRAIERGYSLNEYRLMKMDTKDTILLHSEEEIFQLLDLPYLSPLQRNEK